METIYPTVRVAAVQAAPIFLNLEASVDKACNLIREAGRNGAEVIGFPEGFLPGHPVWYHFHPATAASSRDFAAQLFRNSVEIPSLATDHLCDAARDAGAYVVMGLCERLDGLLGTRFNTQLFIDPEGRIIGKHQKLVPTVSERLVHAPGGADTLRAFDTHFGVSISGLLCAENSNPLAVFTMIAENTGIHIASWPNVPATTALGRSERGIIVGRSFALMSKAFVLNVCGAVTPELVELLVYRDEDREHLTRYELYGGSSIIAPDSSVLAGPMNEEEGILYADADLDQCLYAKVPHDYAGHYNRPDVFTLQVRDHVPAIYERIPYASSPPDSQWHRSPSSSGRSRDPDERSSYEDAAQDV